MKLCSRLLMVFVEIYEKDVTFDYEPHFRKLGVTHDLGWWLVGKPMFHFLFALNELFFAIYYGSGVMRRNAYSSAVFTGCRSLCTPVLPSPSTILNTRKLETLVYPMVKTASVCVPSFWHNRPTGVCRTDRWTDGRTDAFAVAYTPLAK